MPPKPLGLGQSGSSRGKLPSTGLLKAHFFQRQGRKGGAKNAKVFRPSGFVFLCVILYSHWWFTLHGACAEFLIGLRKMGLCHCITGRLLVDGAMKAAVPNRKGPP